MAFTCATANQRRLIIDYLLSARARSARIIPLDQNLITFQHYFDRDVGRFILVFRYVKLARTRWCVAQRNRIKMKIAEFEPDISIID